jgi:DNA-binding NarL/FixJ family response regulator
MKFERLVILSIMLLAVTSTTVNVMVDLGRGASALHVLGECLVIASLLFGILLVGLKSISLKKQLLNQTSDIERARAEALRWKQEASSNLAGLAQAIDRQFDRWSLSAAEKEVGLLLLKGLSLKEIAEVRNVSEKTVRAQSLAIYSKANLAGRAELSAFFLEDLLLP